MGIDRRAISFGDYLEDINPEYVKEIQKTIQPFINDINKKFIFFKFKIDQYGDIVGYIPFIKKSKLWMTELKSSKQGLFLFRVENILLYEIY